MPAIDPKRKAADIEKGMKHAREALALLANELGGNKGAPGKEIAAILIGFQKMEAAFLKAAEAIPEASSDVATWIKAVTGDMDGIRRAMMEIVSEVGTKTPPGKEMSKVLNDFQKVEASFKAAAKGL
jgi:hypothetical protein